MPKDRLNKISCSNYKSEVEVTLEVLSGKWKVLILLNLSEHKVIRFNEFKRLIPDITQKMLSQQLRDLNENGLVNKTIYNQVPPMVEYSLTKIGTDLIPILKSMDKWGKRFVNNFTHLHDISS
ncbi:winged helix-turn-helix transcriptional regulator [Clostridium pasteurianum]|uniref:Putative transcriptional regulator n=1 Tax=Clostridium pasteurianum BC1 TaxID=86416 RepID=R4K8R8_CLOPA|nr:helix-turn-helix domain-containing protein [Clostridium pasteurianum]AGK98958.1 putative transcriptional regulator [Clostridium pasteurianum BC1]